MAQWTNGDYAVHTDPEKVDLEALNDALGSDIMWWARRLGPEDLRTMVYNSLCFSLHGPAAESGQAATGVYPQPTTMGATMFFFKDCPHPLSS